MYTKGVWERRGNQVVVVGSGLVAHCPSPSKDGAMEFIANAQLIAAAPRMYEALKDIVEEGTRTVSDGSHNYNSDLVDRLARRAIAKAEGK